MGWDGRWDEMGDGMRDGMGWAERSSIVGQHIDVARDASRVVGSLGDARSTDEEGDAHVGFVWMLLRDADAPLAKLV
jgi:hypothetical protein